MIFTFIPNPTDDREYAFQQRVIGRGMTLVADGYKLFAAVDVTGASWYNVVSPEDVTYQVDLTPGAETCSCPCTAKHGYCKHMVACTIREEELRENAQVAALEEYARNHGLID